VQEVQLDLLGAHQVEGLGGIERGAMPRVLAQPAVDLAPLIGAAVRGRCLVVLGDLAGGLQQHDAVLLAGTTASRVAFCST